MDCGANLLTDRFNGAALVRARSARCFEASVKEGGVLQRSRARESAEWGSWPAGARSCAGFNGAALVRARSEEIFVELDCSPEASTEPRS